MGVSPRELFHARFQTVELGANGCLSTHALHRRGFRGRPLTHAVMGVPRTGDCTPLDPNLDQIGWYCGNHDYSTEVVGQKLANAWGLYDMSGNVWERNWDWNANYPTGPVTNPEGSVSGSRRVMRGGCWFNVASNCRSAVRYDYDPGARSRFLGFRLARSLPQAFPSQADGLSGIKVGPLLAERHTARPKRRSSRIRPFPARYPRVSRQDGPVWFGDCSG